MVACCRGRRLVWRVAILPARSAMASSHSVADASSRCTLLSSEKPPMSGSTRMEYLANRLRFGVTDNVCGETPGNLLLVFRAYRSRLRCTVTSGRSSRSSNDEFVTNTKRAFSVTQCGSESGLLMALVGGWSEQPDLETGFVQPPPPPTPPVVQSTGDVLEPPPPRPPEQALPPALSMHSSHPLLLLSKLHTVLKQLQAV